MTPPPSLHHNFNGLERYIGRQGYNEHDPYWTVWSGGRMLFLQLLPYQNLALRLKKS